MNQNEDKKELVVILVPKYEEINHQIRACADIKIYYGETKLRLNECNYSLYFDDKLVSSFLSVNNITEGFHEFKVVVEYNQITKIAVATKRYSRYSVINNNNNKTIVYNNKPKYICKRRFPINTAEKGQVYYTSAIKVVSDNITPDYISNLCELFNNNPQFNIQRLVRNIQVIQNKRYNVNYIYTFIGSDNYNTTINKNEGIVIIHLYYPLFLYKDNNYGIILFIDKNRLSDLNYTFRKIYYDYPAKIQNIEYSIASKNRNTIFSTKYNVNCDKFNGEVQKLANSQKYSTVEKKYKLLKKWKYIRNYGTYGTYRKNKQIIKVRYKTRGNNVSDWVYYTTAIDIPYYRLVTKRHKKNS